MIFKQDTMTGAQKRYWLFNIFIVLVWLVEHYYPRERGDTFDLLPLLFLSGLIMLFFIISVVFWAKAYGKSGFLITFSTFLFNLIIPFLPIIVTVYSTTRALKSLGY